MPAPVDEAPADEPKSCVKCGYVRQPADSAPDYECPRCGVVYAKAEAARRAQERSRDIEAGRVIAGERRAPSLERPEPAVPDPERDAAPPRLAAHIVYLLYAIPIGVTALAGVIVAYSMRARQRGTWLASHYTWQIRTFWYWRRSCCPRSPPRWSRSSPSRSTSRPGRASTRGSSCWGC
ncbi:MAG: hypothetical protein IPI87_01980 [Betaproteobacteria bacterium]|nr:hypothetical protein [Betaproteobacteria bacterium]